MAKKDDLCHLNHKIESGRKYLRNVELIAKANI